MCVFVDCGIDEDFVVIVFEYVGEVCEVVYCYLWVMCVVFVGCVVVGCWCGDEGFVGCGKLYFV